MLAVRADTEGRGLGVRLKAFQRDEVLGRGVRRMAWTFDPLRARNAYLNLTKLGAVVRAYRKDMYGQTDSKLHRGIGTDRFVALWVLDSDRVERRLERALSGVAAERPGGSADFGGSVPLALDADKDGPSGLPCPAAPCLDLEAPRVAVSIPDDIGIVMNRAPELAVAWRDATRAVFPHYLARGYEVRELVRPRTEGEPATYHMERRPSVDADGAPPATSANGNER